MNETLTSCEQFEDAIHRVLDGDLPPAALAVPHVEVCPTCRESAATVVAMLAGLQALPPIEPPPGFATRVLPAVVAERRRSDVRRSVRIAMASLAAAVVVAFLAIHNRTADRPAMVVKSPSLPNAAPPSVGRSFADAGSAVVSLTRRATQESLSPARNLFASLDTPRPLPIPISASPVVVPSASPVQPITNTAKRALNLFIRDVGGFASLPQQKS